MTLLPRLTRRDFLVTSAAAATASVAGAQVPRHQAAMSLSPAITALPVLSGHARPFTVAERAARIERAKALMATAKIDAIVLANSTTSSVYFANLRLNGGERLWALVLPARAKPFLVCPAFEEGRARELLADGPLGKTPKCWSGRRTKAPSLHSAKV